MEKTAGYIWGGHRRIIGRPKTCGEESWKQRYNWGGHRKIIGSAKTYREESWKQVHMGWNEEL